MAEGTPSRKGGGGDISNDLLIRFHENVIQKSSFEFSAKITIYLDGLQRARDPGGGHIGTATHIYKKMCTGGDFDISK